MIKEVIEAQIESYLKFKEFRYNDKEIDNIINDLKQSIDKAISIEDIKTNSFMSCYNQNNNINLEKLKESFEAGRKTKLDFSINEYCLEYLKFNDYLKSKGIDINIQPPIITDTDRLDWVVNNLYPLKDFEIFEPIIDLRDFIDRNIINFF